MSKDDGGERGDGRAHQGEESRAETAAAARVALFRAARARGVERGRARLIAGLDIINETLANTAFLAGDAFSFADIDLLAAIDFAKWGARLTPDESLTHLHRWRGEAKAALAE